jgi:uncharacterized membrane protein YqhA
MPYEPQDTELPGTGPAGTRPERRAGTAAGRIERSLAASLGLAVIPVAFLLLAGLGAFVYGAAVFFDLIVQIARHPFPAGHQIGLFLLDIDMFLIGATMLISAIGFYELFIGEIRVGGSARMPAWLEMRDLNDLKGRVIAMIVMVLAVTFVELAVDAVEAEKGLQVLELGGGVGIVIIALTAFLRLTGHVPDRD